MKLYKLVRNDHVGYDQYESCIVAANNPDHARKLASLEFTRSTYTIWSDDVGVELIGTAHARLMPGVIHSAFNAG